MPTAISVSRQSSLYFLVLTGFFVPLSITATDLSMALTAILAVVSGYIFQEFDYIKRNPMVWCAVWIVILVALSMSWSIAPWIERFSALHKYAKLLYIPLLMAVCTDSKWRDRTIMAFITGVAVTVVLSCLKAWFGLPIGHNPNPSFIFYTHIETGFLVAFATYLAALCAWKNRRWRWVYIILIVAFTYQEFFINDGRTGWVAYLVLLILLGIQIWGWKGLIMGAGIIAVLGVGVYYTSANFRNILQQSEHEITLYNQGQPQTSLGYRLNFNKLSWRMIKEHPIIGYGAGSFAPASKLLGGVPGWKIVQTPHSEYMMMLVEFGFVGLISLLTLFAVQWVLSFRLGEMKYFAQGLLLAFMVSAFYNSFLYSTVSGHFFVLFSALFFGRYYYNFSWKRGVSGTSKKYNEQHNSPK